jgi:hypothetical protein
MPTGSAGQGADAVETEVAVPRVIGVEHIHLLDRLLGAVEHLGQLLRIGGRIAESGFERRASRVDTHPSRDSADLTQGRAERRAERVRGIADDFGRGVLELESRRTVIGDVGRANRHVHPDRRHAHRHLHAAAHVDAELDRHFHRALLREALLEVVAQLAARLGAGIDQRDAGLGERGRRRDGADQHGRWQGKSGPDHLRAPFLAVDPGPRRTGECERGRHSDILTPSRRGRRPVLRRGWRLR